MIQRSTDAAFLNGVLAHPAVRSWVTLGKDLELDMSGLVANPDNVFLANEFGGFLFIKQAPCLYEVHTQFLPEGRGPKILHAAREAAWHMFLETDCVVIKTFVADGNVAAHKLTIAMGFELVEPGEVLGAVGTHFVLTLKAWAKRMLCQQQQ